MLTLNDGRAELWQWDTGRTLAVDADCSQVHFSNKVFGRSIDVDVAGGVAIIPDILLQTDKDLNVWAFVGTAENGYTKISKTFKVNRRNKPADYVFTPTDQMTLQMIQRQIGDLADLTTEAKDTLVAAINEAAKSGGGGGGVELDTTLTQSGQAADAAEVGARLSLLSEEIANIAGGNGLTTAQINALDGMFKVCAFIKADVSEEYNAFRTAFDIEAATITGISATYTGGNVTAGTSVDALTGIVVTANYSDGSKRTVTGYTLSGTIAEGSNTITVTYEGMTTSFTVIGVAEAVILSSISVTYSGGSVPAGTALDDLTGIVVTAQYSDGSTATVTGYTMSGEITEGSNTITVTYQDKTTTFSVTGTAVSQVYTVTNNLTNVTNSNSATTASGYYSATLSAAEGYNINVIITMGGVDITADVYTEDGTILITDVTGNIVITATAELASSPVIYQLANTPRTVNADLYEDTGLTFGYESANGYTKAWTILVDAVVSTRSKVLFGVKDSETNAKCLQFQTNGAGNGQIYINNNSSVQSPVNSEERHRFVITHAANADKTATVHIVSDGVVASTLVSASYGSFVYSGYAGNLYIGGKSAADFVGTINEFIIYEGVLSDAHISEFLGVA